MRLTSKEFDPENPKRTKRYKSTQIGSIDMEYDSNDQELICYQMSSEGKECFVPGNKPLSKAVLKAEIEKLRRPGMTHFVLATYFSPAELQHLYETKGFWEIGTVVPVSYGAYNVKFNYNVKEDGKVKTIYVQIYDVFHWFPTNLEKTAAAFGLKKLAYDRKHITKECLNDHTFRDYAMNDCHITEKLFRQARDYYYKKYSIDIADRAITPPHLGMTIYRTHYQGEDINFAPNWRLRRNSMQCDHGPISEVWCQQTLIGDYVELDAKSNFLISAVALGGLPANADQVFECFEDTEPPENTQGWCHIEFEYPNGAQYPLLPVQNRERTWYPLAGESWCTLADVRKAKQYYPELKVLWLWSAWYYPKECDQTFIKFLQDNIDARKRASTPDTPDYNPAMALLEKLVGVSSIGKLIQSKSGCSAERLKKLAEEYGLPIEIVAQPFFDDPRKDSHKLGSNWCPEWHSLILGMSRALMADAIIQTHSLYTKADSVITTFAQAEAFQASYKGPLTFDEKARGPALTIRNVGQCHLGAKLGKFTEGDKLVYHAIQCQDKNLVVKALEQGTLFEYTRKKHTTLLQAIKTERKFFSNYEVKMKSDLSWRGGRILNPDGTTKPHPQVPELLRGNNSRTMSEQQIGE